MILTKGPVSRILPAIGLVVLMGCAHKSPYAGVPYKDIPLNGTTTTFTIANRQAWLIIPTKPHKGRWVWFAPFTPIDRDGAARVYAAQMLDAGFAVAGVDIGVSCGSPKGVAVFDQFYQYMVRRGLDPRVRFLAQSNGGLQAYAWGFRNASRVDRIAGIYPATDLRSWPGVDQLMTLPGAMGFELTVDQLRARLPEFNPIENLQPLAAAGVEVFHLHGDLDDVVSIDANSREVMRRYRNLGGVASLEIVPGRGHLSKAHFFSSWRLVRFLKK